MHEYWAGGADAARGVRSTEMHPASTRNTGQQFDNVSHGGPVGFQKRPTIALDLRCTAQQAGKLVEVQRLMSLLPKRDRQMDGQTNLHDLELETIHWF